MKILRFITTAAIAALGFVASESTARAQDLFYAALSGASEVPANPSLAIGRAWANFDFQSRTIWYCVESNAVGATAAHIHNAATGVNGPVIFPLAGGPNVWTGSTPPLTAAQITEMYNGRLYVNVHTAAIPTGEIRGQLSKTFSRTTAANMSPANEVPPAPSVATGVGRAILHEPEHILYYEVSVSGLGSAATAAHIHQAPAGVNGPVIVTLKGGNTGPGTAEYCGTATLTTAQITTLLANGLYFNVHTTAIPSGEIRGQLLVQVENFAASLTGTEEVPANGSINTGFGTFKFGPGPNTIAYRQNWTGALTTASHIHSEFPLASGGVTFPLAPALGPWLGVTAALTAAQQTDLFRVRMYSNVHSTPFPGGEVRGQLRQNPYYFGYPGATAAGLLGRKLRIESSGAPIINTNWTCKLFDAQPTTFASLIYAEDLAINPLDLMTFGYPDCSVLWVNALTGYPTSSDANGCASQTFLVPNLTTFIGQDFYFQWVASDANNLSWSDALALYVEG